MRTAEGSRRVAPYEEVPDRPAPDDEPEDPARADPPEREDARPEERDAAPDERDGPPDARDAAAERVDPLDRDADARVAVDARDVRPRPAAAAGLRRSAAGISSVTTAFVSVGISFSRKLAIRSSWRRYSRASLTVSESLSASASVSIAV